jgi:serine/threonine-protein kinase RsbW
VSSRTPDPNNHATMLVRNGPLLGPVLSRVIGMLAARAQCPIDRLDDALLVADTVAAHGPDYGHNGSVRVDLAAKPGSIELTIGALRPQGAHQLLADAELPGVGNVLERVSDLVEVRDDADGEALYIQLGFGS